MSEVLVIRLKGVPDAQTNVVQAEWLVVDANGARRGNVESGFLSEALPRATDRRVLGIVPGTDVLLAEPVLPAKSGAKLALIVPFALEEQLANDIDDLHFAVGKRESRPGTPVAVVARDKMDAWQRAFQAAQLPIDGLYAESGALPVTPNAVTLLVDSGRVYVRRPDLPGAVLEVEPLIEALQLALASGEEAREHVTIYVTEEEYERDRDLLEGLREFTASLQLKLLPDGPLPLLAATIAKAGAVSLLQGPYATRKRINVTFAPWRWAAVLAVIFFGLHLGMKGWQLYRAKGLEARLDAQIAQVFQQAMPGAAVPEPLAARGQMQSRLNQLRRTAPVSGMMVALSTLGEALSQAPDTRLEALSYRNNQTDLRVLAPSVEALDRIQHVATERGVKSKITSTRPRDSKVEGQLQLTSAGS